MLRDVRGIGQGWSATRTKFAILPSCFQVSRNGLTNSVFTLYELASGDDTESEGKVRVLEQVFRAHWSGACKHLIVRLQFCRLNILKSQMQAHPFPPLARAAPKAFITLQEHPPL